MSVTFRDYYEVLGVPRDASAKDIQRAYRKQARKLHPDVNKAADASEQFKVLAEAYEVLKDTEKRERYDTLGSRWKDGDTFTPPPGWESRGSGFGAGGFRGGGVEFDDLGGFSSFFESMFGGGDGGFEHRAPRQRPGRSIESAITISLADAYHGAKRAFTLETTELDAHGRAQRKTKSYEVKIPAGSTQGTTIRLAGQGGAGMGGGPAGDLFLRLDIAPDTRFRLDGHDLWTTLRVSPQEAMLGARVPVPTMKGEAEVAVPAGSSSGKKLRLGGMGLAKRGGGRGDLIAELEIVVPDDPSPEEQAAYEELARVSRFDPRRAR